MPIVTSLLDHILVISKLDVISLNAAIRLPRFECLLPLELSGHFNAIVVDTSLFLSLQILLILLFQFVCLHLLHDLFSSLLIHESVAAHELISHALYEGC